MILYALDYLRRGWSIIPVGADKRPVVTADGRFAWRSFQSRRMTEAEARLWWDVEHPPGIAVVCGKVSGLIVLDVEVLGVQLRHFDGRLPETLTAVSQSGGLHYYFRWRPERLRHVIADADMRRLADVKSDGGYVVAPPTSGEKGDYAWVTRAPLADLPHEFDFPVEAHPRPMRPGPCAPLGGRYSSRSEKLMAIARNIISTGGSNDDVFDAWLASEAGSKVVKMTEESAAKYLAATCAKVRGTTPPPKAPAKAPGGPVVRLSVVSLAWARVGSVRRLMLRLRTPDGSTVRETVTFGPGPRTDAFLAALPDPHCGATVLAVLEEREWNGRKVLQVSRWVLPDQART